MRLYLIQKNYRTFHNYLHQIFLFCYLLFVLNVYSLLYFLKIFKLLLSLTRTMSQEISKDPFEFCDLASITSNDEHYEINNKLNLLLTNIERIDKNVLKLNQLVDMLISKQTIMEITLSSINADYINTREIIHKTETLCSKILNIIEERALSYERAIEDAAQQIQIVTQKVIL
ncbi:unnamed protein product [Didymodactylos carnosus]|uniref:Uncharacterized protein n=1 Tax=Didymodactylos carnosus TaxID=1234261 RepID=A0A816EIU0_9BILA|nr:unnamed protein product [Didymodactylos carnosus]CAF4586429.1 unnamed protein product [Didymodactylos carnosus]